MRLENLSQAEGRIRDVERFVNQACFSGFPYSPEERKELIELLRLGAKVRFGMRDRPEEAKALAAA